ncbi:unnamed protein product [Fraxinus pennsylvanica]|uniref:DM2 domain-containing protein n=1 Tax=Fraxinus pennsylvanica TaxID=56036 RepID=A0AAD1ZPB4_9LAMI|nr:unnamed protein product [Fraxinus pennsylvanica]
MEPLFHRHKYTVPFAYFQVLGGASSSRSSSWSVLNRHFPVVQASERNLGKMIPQRMRKAVMENPKKLANLIDLVNLPSTLREFMGQSQSSRLGCFRRVWLHIKENNLQDPNNKNVVNCDEKLKRILLGAKMTIASSSRPFTFDI